MAGCYIMVPNCACIISHIIHCFSYKMGLHCINKIIIIYFGLSLEIISVIEKQGCVFFLPYLLNIIKRRSHRNVKLFIFNKIIRNKKSNLIVRQLTDLFTILKIFLMPKLMKE